MNDVILEDTEVISVRANITAGIGTFVSGATAEAVINILDDEGKVVYV